MTTCDLCGNVLDEGQTVCGRCGRPVTAVGNAAAVDRAVSAAPAQSSPGAPEPGPPPPPRTPFIDSQIEDLLRKALVFLRRKDLDGARECIDEGLKLDPTDPQLQAARGNLLEAEGDDLGAYRAYQAACESGSPDPDTETRLARIAIRLEPSILAALQPPRTQSDLPERVRSQLPAEARMMLDLAERPAPAPTRRQRELTAVLSVIVPGLGQVLNHEYIKAAIMFVVWGGCLAILLPSLSDSIPHGAPGGVRSAAGAAAPISSTVWIALAIMAMDYLVSIADASISKRNERGAASP